MFPCITFIASDAFFIAAIVSALRFADSRVLTCISSCSRVPASRSKSASFVFFRCNAAFAATDRYLRQQIHLQIDHSDYLPALFVMMFALAFFVSSSIFFSKYSSFFSIICSCCRSVTIASRAEALGSRRPPK